jgi:16S rRNA (guanine527-N7)-methyltransferase
MTRDEFETAARISVSDGTFGRLEAFAREVIAWNRAINLVAPSQIGLLWPRHIVDSAQLIHHAGSAPRIWADIGSGAGFPGMVIAILAGELMPRCRVHLVEVDQRKSAFLAHVARQTATACTVHAEESGQVGPIGADVVSARALAPLDRLIGMAARHLAPGGRALLLKGARHGAEIAAARSVWNFTLKVHPSLTDPDAVVLEIGSPRRV